MTLELTTPSIEARQYVEELLSAVGTQKRELYSHEEVENMLLDIYLLLKSN
jgi:hypothetical protein